MAKCDKWVIKHLWSGSSRKTIIFLKTNDFNQISYSNIDIKIDPQRFKGFKRVKSH